MKNNTLISPKDLSVLLNVTPNLVYKLIQTGNIEVFQDGTNRKKLLPSSVRQILEQRGFVYPKKIFSLEGLKGGIGKTTLSIALAEGAARYGAKVLAIDLDMQGNMTEYFTGAKNNNKVLVHVIKGGTNVEDIIHQRSEYLDFIPSSLDNSRLEIELNKTLNYKTFFKQLLLPIINKYDVVIIDCPPTLSKITTLATCAADLVIIPVNADRDSMTGMKYQISEIKNLEQTFEMAIKYKILWNKFDARERLSGHYIQEIYTYSEATNNIFPIVMRTDATYKNSKALKQSIFSMKKSAAREDAEQLAQEILGFPNWNIKKNKAEE